MTSFSETETMTLKRLEVALRKSDFKLLKEGAYRLYEKFHDGFKFEYIDSLKNLLYSVNNSNVPSDIKDILIPTIEDILSANGTSAASEALSYENPNLNKISPLTSLSYTERKNQEETKEEKISRPHPEMLSAFDVFAQPKTSRTDFTQAKTEYKNFTLPETTDNIEIKPAQEIQNKNETISTETPQTDISSNKTDFEEFALPKINPAPMEEISTDNFDVISNEILTAEKEQQTPVQISFLQEEEKENQPIYAPQSSEQSFAEKKNKVLSIFYSQINSEDKNRNIKKYLEMVSKISNEKTDFAEIIRLISSVNTQSNTSVAELTNVFEQIQNRSLKINLITNSTNSNLIGLVDSMKIPYKFNSSDEKINILPLFGLTNMYKCIQCREEYIDLKDDINPYIIQCPKCKSPMLPDFSCIETKMNFDFYNNAIINLANSDIWLILYPSAAEKLMLDIMKSALILSRSVENIFICDKDINTKETYRNAFTSVNKDIKVNIDINAMEEFLKIA